MKSIISKYGTIAALTIILIASLFLRTYKLESVPPSISWDEAAVGYNAFTIANWGRDEWGNFMPLTFKSFEDDKHPVHIYITALFVKILGLSDFSVRLPSAVFGTLNVLLVFLLAKKLFNSKLTGFITAFMMAISPYSLQFSRFNHELSFELFFFLLGLVLFFKGIEKKAYFIPLATISFCVSILTYHSAIVVVPFMMLILTLLYFKDITKEKTYLYISIGIVGIFGFILFLNPALLGIARINQTGFTKEDLEKTQVYKNTQNELYTRISIVYEQYLDHFRPQYLYISGDKNARHSSQYAGEFYISDILFFIIGVLVLLYKRKKYSVILLAWVFIAPLPSALVKEAPHAARAGFMLGSFNIIAAFGLYSLISFVKQKYLKLIFVAIVLVFNLSLFKNYLYNYYVKYPLEKAIDWQYGMKQIVDYASEHPEYFQVYMTDARSQPYIFFLYYLKTPLPDYLASVSFNTKESKSYNLVSAYKGYYFGVGDPIEYVPTEYIMQILEPSKFSGLRYKDGFDVLKVIKYPDGGDGYFIVTAKK